MAVHEYLLQTRFFDMDSFGHVNNAIFIGYCENAREKLYREEAAALLEGEERALVEPGVDYFGLIGDAHFPLVTGQRIEYRAQLTHRPEPILVRVWVTRVGRSSHAVGFEIAEPDGSVVYAVAEAVMVLVDRVTGRPSEQPEGQRAVLRSWGGEPVAFR